MEHTSFYTLHFCTTYRWATILLFPWSPDFGFPGVLKMMQHLKRKQIVWIWCSFPGLVSIIFKTNCHNGCESTPGVFLARFGFHLFPMVLHSSFYVSTFPTNFTFWFNCRQFYQCSSFIIYQIPASQFQRGLVLRIRPLCMTGQSSWNNISTILSLRSTSIYIVHPHLLKFDRLHIYPVASIRQSFLCQYFSFFFLRYRDKQLVSALFRISYICPSNQIFSRSEYIYSNWCTLHTFFSSLRQKFNKS